MTTDSLAARIAAIAAPDAMTPTAAPGLTVYALRGPAERMHLVYRPSLCVVAQGAKVACIGARRYAYNPSRFFFSAIPVPALLQVKDASEAPLLGLVLELEPELVARVALEIDEVAREGAAPARHAQSAPEVEACWTGRMHDDLAAALTRLVAAASDPLRRHVLYAGALREVVFHLLTGAEGEPLRRALRQEGSLQAVVGAARHMDQHFRATFAVAELARRAGMSESAFFAHFKRLTRLSPLQYLKRIRLVHARAALTAGRSVTEAAFDVGYASSSQFSREFRAVFGEPPSVLLRRPAPAPTTTTPTTRPTAKRARQSAR